MSWWNNRTLPWDESDFVSGLLALHGAGAVGASLGPDGLTPSGEGALTDGDHIYAVISKEEIDRIGPSSTVLYVGQGKANRVQSLLTNRHSATRALRHIGAVGQRAVAIAWRQVRSDSEQRLSRDSRLIEAFLLHRIAEKHGELPPCNLRWEGYFVGRLLESMMRHALRRGGATSGRKQSKLRGIRSYDWPPTLDEKRGGSIEPGTSWCDAPNQFGFSLGWLWPESWNGARHRIPFWSPGQLVLAAKGEDGSWEPLGKPSRALTGLGEASDNAEFGDAWRAIDDASARLGKGSPIALLESWLTDI